MAIRDGARGRVDDKRSVERTEPLATLGPWAKGPFEWICVLVNVHVLSSCELFPSPAWIKRARGRRLGGEPQPTYNVAASSSSECRSHLIRWCHPPKRLAAVPLVSAPRAAQSIADPLQECGTVPAVVAGHSGRCRTSLGNVAASGSAAGSTSHPPTYRRPGMRPSRSQRRTTSGDLPLARAN